MVDVIKKGIKKQSYVRKIEAIDVGLVSVDVSNESKPILGNKYIFFENGKKPPLELMINEQNHLVQGIHFFVQDEKILFDNKLPDFTLATEGIEIHETLFNDRDLGVNYFKPFTLKLVDNDLWIISEFKDHIRAHLLSDDFFVLVDSECSICGFILKGLSVLEVDELYKAEVI